MYKSQSFPVLLQAGKKRLPYNCIQEFHRFCMAALFCLPVEILGKVGTYTCTFGMSQVLHVVKYLPASAGDLRDTDSIPESG